MIIEGSLVVWVGDERREVGPGDAAYLPRNVPHTYTVTSESAKILVIVTPGGLEQAFREAGWDLVREPPGGWQCTPAAVTAAMAKMGCRTIGPPKPVTDGPMAPSAWTPLG